MASKKEQTEKAKSKPKTKLTRDDVTLALLPKIRIEHAKSDTELIARHIDDVCEALEIE